VVFTGGIGENAAMVRELSLKKLALLGFDVDHDRNLAARFGTETIDKPDETSLACPQCLEGRLVQRRSRYGKTFHSCDRYP
ncbi:topoisomerase DNA-binding C4 zinc finger domain-containing protein, partial [Pantoea agglomerans]|uniref:topoisomerase DNA-binding C4 zinc finger domain-containing protein n=1 Tax=Enterobacter agglomerans TaxID=549 RepID=UPI001F5D457B